MTTPVYSRVLLKLSGEALMGEQAFGIDPKVTQAMADAIKDLVNAGVEPAIVVGGGNIFRGVSLAAEGVNQVTADHMGMLATTINALALYNALKQNGMAARVMSAIPMDGVCENYSWWKAIEHLQQGEVVIFAAGTGNPFFTTDSAASLRAIEIQADLMIKATKVDGVYSADPVKHPDAQRFENLSYDEVIHQELAVMDMASVILCRDHKMPLRVLNMSKQHALLHAVMGKNEGTLIHS
ncbi:UMP kinase [Candidatus Venteria ishoeyi]|uniref:UMP kinase n=1 Tax=Candidatus Venteria ishoeyi TaxID=1899563 RepID=UPI0025A5AFDC|nr:UMP kinase [Candidatus Venteria ishoeyi]MDM8547979.1 UMP kinase [Candidatus Venteria ishoeyi]